MNVLPLDIINKHDWNTIPELLKSKPKQLFKKHLQTKLLQFLVHEGVYVDVYNLADKLFLISS